MIRHIRWQAFIALAAIVLLGGLLWYLALTRTTVIAPDYGGTYVEGIAGRFHYINPILSQYNEVDKDLVSLIFTGLTDSNQAGEIVPDLAERWEISDDELTYTFYLRKDVYWHDGTRFTADDVLFTIRAIQDPDYQGVPDLAELWRTVAVEKVDHYTVKFTLQEPYTPFMDYTTIGLLPAHLLKEVPAKLLPENEFNVNPVGTGLFKVKEVSPEHIVLEKNDFFYGPKPYLDRIEFKFYPDYESVFSAYERGEVQGISRVLPADLPQVRENENLNLFTARLSGYVLIFLNLNKPFFQEREVRQAMLYAIDRQEIIDQILDGQGIAAAPSPILPKTWAYNDNLKKCEYDPEKAKALLDEAGWVDSDEDGVREKEGIKLDFALLTYDDEVQIKIIEEIARQLWKVGISAQTQKIGVPGIAELLRTRRFDAVLPPVWELPPDPDPYPMWHSTQTVDEGQNYSGFANREADQIMENARRISNQTVRAELYHRFQEIFAEEVPSILLYYPVYNYAIDKTIRGVQVGPMFDSSDRFRNISQWYIKMKRIMVSEAGG